MSLLITAPIKRQLTVFERIIGETAPTYSTNKFLRVEDIIKLRELCHGILTGHYAARYELDEHAYRLLKCIARDLVDFCNTHPKTTYWQLKNRAAPT